MIWKNCSSHEVVEFNIGWSMHHHQSCTKLLQSIFYEFVERHLRKADILQMTTSVNSVNWKFKPPPSSPPSLPKHRGELTFPVRTTLLGHLSVQLQGPQAAWSLHVAHTGMEAEIVPCHGLSRKTWGSHQGAARGGFSMGGTEGCRSSTRESCKDLRLPLIIWKS